MNNDPFENILQSLTGSGRRVDPTPAWKSDILARARREAMTAPKKRTQVPHWQMAALAAAWVAIFVLRFTISPDPASDGNHSPGALSLGSPAGGVALMGSAYFLASKEYRTLTE